MNSILDISVSCYPDYRSTDGQPVNLLAWLQSAKHAGKVKTIRATDDKTDRDKLKSSLPAITPSGLFEKREAAGLLEHSGLMQIDIDNIQDAAATKKILSDIENVAYAGLSVSGRGLWALIPIAHSEHHKEYFILIEKALSGMGIKIDSNCKDVCRLRGYSYDPDAYFNHNAKTLEQWYKDPPKKHFQPQYNNRNSFDNQSKVETLINEICSRRIDLTMDYEAWFNLGCSFANEFGEAGRNYFQTVSQFHPKYNPTDTDRQFKHCLHHRYDITISTFFAACKDAGIMFKENVSVAAKRNEPELIPTLILEDIQLQGETYTGKDFDNLIIVWVKAKNKNFELLFTQDENCLPFGERKEVVKSIETYFNKNFKPIMYEGEKVYCNIFLN